ncbi:MAG: hypothetical protein HYU64_20390 [Armatimonadetes bacterium]|nr:hypothetical protein [Armatimonadota bacterium]
MIPELNPSGLIGVGETPQQLQEKAPKKDETDQGEHFSWQNRADLKVYGPYCPRAGTESDQAVETGMEDTPVRRLEDNGQARAPIHLLMEEPQETEAPSALDRVMEEARTSSNPVLKSLEPILRDSRFVKINHDRIREIAKGLTEKELTPANWKFPVFIDEDSDRTIDFFMLGNAINFKFWENQDPNQKFATEYNGSNWDGAFGMWACLKRALDRGIPVLDADYLGNLTMEQGREIFSGNMEIPMLKERVEIFRQVGQVLKEKYNGHFSNLVKDAGYKCFDDGNGIVERLARDFSSYNDVSRLDETGEDLKFHKRAQLAVGMLYNRLKGTGLFDIKDINELTVFADYELPKGLRKLGIMEYTDFLAEKVDSRELILGDSREEQEIRANTIYAAKLLEDEVNRLGKHKVNALNIDFFLWWNGSHSSDSYHHLTETTAY